jgi:hypothetical protein
VKRVVRRLQREIRGATRNPFPGERRLIVHACHHKTGTVWFKRILRRTCATHGLVFHAGAQDELRPDIGVFFQQKGRVDLERLPPFRGSHMIRDPRDMIVSGYFYHQWTQEPWALVPDDRYGGLSHQEYLQTLSPADGLLVEIDAFASGPDLRDMLAWSYGHPDVMELRYEDVIADEERSFRALFEHYGFTPAAVERCLGVAHEFTFARQKRLEGDRRTSHLRSGRTGQWRELMEPVHVERVKERLGDALVQLGYESDLDW